jgi:hypothetical protein
MSNGFASALELSARIVRENLDAAATPSASVPAGYFPRTLFALVSIFFLSDALSLPSCSIWEARALALRAWLASGIGYLRFSGSPNSLLGSAFFLDVVSFAIPLLLNLKHTAGTMTKDWQRG